MKDILGYNLDSLSEWLISVGEKGFRAKQIQDWLYKGVNDFEEMKNLSQSTLRKLNEAFFLGMPEIYKKFTSKEDGTVKYLLKLYDGNIIECVLMRYKHGNSVCISSQVGCRMGCTFCASTLDGRIRDLSYSEMLGQIIVVSKDIAERISNVVIMGSGEPFDNYENTLMFMKEANQKKGLGIGARHITVSTCGIVPKIYELADEGFQATLAISLHAVNNVMREKSMPITKKYSIEEVLEACEYYTAKTNRRVSFEYALISGFNDSVKDAETLGKLLKGTLSHVNLIPLNEVEECGLKKSNMKTVEKFKKILLNNGIETTVRREMGADINAACGQLRRDYADN